MCPGPTDNLQLVGDTCKMAVIDKELASLNINIACLQVTYLADSSTIREYNYTFFWQGLPLDEPRQCGVSFAVKISHIAAIETPAGGTKRVPDVHVSTSSGPVHLISIYTPTLWFTSEPSDQFYETLDDTMSRTPITEGLNLLGDFNVKLGADSEVGQPAQGIMVSAG